MNQQPIMNEPSTPTPRPKRTGLWIALGVGGGITLVGLDRLSDDLINIIQHG